MTDEPDGPLRGVFADIEHALSRGPADVVAADEAEAMSDDDLDEAMWFALDGLLNGAPPDDLPPGPRMLYTTRLVEWDVGNGGFAHAVDCVQQHLDHAIAGYLLLGDEASADLIRRARALDDPVALDALDAEVDGPPWHEVPWGTAARAAYVRAHRDEFRLG